MLPRLVAIFAHPDDESFGPSGTLALMAKTHEIHLICATKGGAGQNSLNTNEPLTEVRSRELQRSATIIGIHHVHFLNYEDGTLSNNLYHAIAKDIQEIIDPLQPELFLTFEPRGISGHIDHITMSMVTSYIFERADYAKELWYYCTEESRAPTSEYFIYRPPGYPRERIDKIHDITTVWDKKIQAMLAHETQVEDARRIIKHLQPLPKEEFFLVKKK
ncbi:PIG-L family deacetylase [Candidatus Roizmanbacteria bacterium]|nr:PIG-L family deacetylase [Candidatus Roizmanbacteria bacterium]